MYLMVVKRGDFQQYDRLHKTFAATPVQVVWDRRRRDRRDVKASAVEIERRLSERRGPPPASWTGLNFVVIEADPT